MTALKIGWFIVLLFGVVGPAAAGDQVYRHSGVVLDIADDGTTITLAEMGPWRMSAGATTSVERTIVVTPMTEFVMVKRREQTPSGYRGDFVETPLGPQGVYFMDFVTIECLHDGGRMIALKVIVTNGSEL